MSPSTLSTGRSRRIEKFISQYADTAVDAEYESRRVHRRYTMTESVDILMDSYETPAEVVMASGRDISAGGIGLFAHRPIKPGTQMIVSINNGVEKFISKAVAVHSTLSVGLFKIGAKFTL